MNDEPRDFVPFGLAADIDERPDFVTAVGLRAWRGFEWCESALGLIAVFIVGFAPTLLALLAMIISAFFALWPAVLLYGAFLWLIGPPSWWIKSTAERALPLGSDFALRIARQAGQLQVGTRCLWGLVWIVQFAVCLCVGVGVHQYVAAARPGAQSWVVTAIFCAGQIAMTLGANLYLLLAAAAAHPQAEFLARLQRHRFWVDLLLTIVVLACADQLL